MAEAAFALVVPPVAGKGRGRVTFFLPLFLGARTLAGLRLSVLAVDSAEKDASSQHPMRQLFNVLRM